ncbi:MAG: hypothetical protein U1F36_14165 [Planctomycetota bacterium]
MNPARAIGAGFLEDLVEILGADGDREPLADLLPFVEACDARFEVRCVAALDSAARRFGVAAPIAFPGEPFAIGRAIRARRLSPSAVALLARLDDLALGLLYRETASACGESSVAPELAGLLRALVIQCRAATANGWVVLLLEGT